MRDNLDSFEKILNEGLRLQRMIEKNPRAVYHMSFTKPDDRRDRSEILLTIKPDFKRRSAIIIPDLEFAKAIMKDQRELKLIDKAVDTLRVWGIEQFQLDLNGKLSDAYKTQIAFSKTSLNVDENKDFSDKIPKEQLTTEQIQYDIEMGKDLREKQQREIHLAYNLDVKELGLSVHIRPNFKENNAMLIVSDKFDFEDKSCMELLGFAVAIVKIWDLEEFSVGKEREEMT